MTEGRRLITNEIVEISGHDRFRWVGRVDHVINTGGIKVSPEEVESHIGHWLKSQGIDNNIFIFGLPDIKLGERLCLAVEGIKLPIESMQLLEGLVAILPKYHVPKEILTVRQFVYTPNGKIKRNATKALINTL